MRNSNYPKDKLVRLAQESMSYFQHIVNIKDDAEKAFWSDCLSLSKQWHDLINDPSLDSKKVKALIEKLEILNSKDCSHHLHWMTKTVKYWYEEIS
jgi:hypothetical protein